MMLDAVADLPCERVGQRRARMLPHEGLERVLHIRPPRGVVSRVRLRVIVHRYAALLHVLDRRIDDARRIQGIASAVHREDRLVAQVVREDQPVVDVARREDHEIAVQRQNARERRRLAHRNEVRAGASVRHTRHDDPVLVDVVAALHGVGDRDEVQRLIVAPPRRVGPRIWDHVDLLGARQCANRPRPDRRVRRAPADAAMELKPDLIPARRIVGLGHVHRVMVLDAVARPVRQPDDPGWLHAVRAAAPQTPVRLVERDARSHDRLDEPRRLLARRRLKERLEGAVNRRRLRRRSRR